MRTYWYACFVSLYVPNLQILAELCSETWRYYKTKQIPEKTISNLIIIKSNYTVVSGLVLVGFMLYINIEEEDGIRDAYF